MAPSEFTNRFWNGTNRTEVIVWIASLSIVMHKRKAVFIRFTHYMTFSAEHVVTGRVHIILIRALTLGYIEVVYLKVMHLAVCI